MGRDTTIHNRLLPSFGYVLIRRGEVRCFGLWVHRWEGRCAPVSLRAGEQEKTQLRLNLICILLPTILPWERLSLLKKGCKVFERRGGTK